jgi:hypothetical protein
MKNLILGLLLAFGLIESASAENTNFYCGRGADTYIVDSTEMAFVVQGRKMKIYFDGRLGDKTFKYSKTPQGYLVEIPSHENPKTYYTYTFKTDRNGTSWAEAYNPSYGSSIQKIPCLREDM